MTKEPSSPFGFTVSTTKSDGRTWLTITRNDGVSASLSCQTSHDSGETIASQVLTEFAEAVKAHFIEVKP